MPILSVTIQAQIPSSVVLAREGPRVPVVARVPTQLDALLRKQGNCVPAPVSGMGLIDTGASLTMVDEAAVRQLGVSPVGETRLGTPQGTCRSLLFPMRISIEVPPNTPMIAAEIARVAVGPLAQQGLLCLIGRDILQHCLLVYDGLNGRFTIAI